MFNEKFWLAIAFLAFILLVLKFARASILKSLDGKSKAIAEEILAAKEMKEKAIYLLEKSERFQKESEAYAKKLIKDAEDEAAKFTAEAKQMVADEISKKTAASLERIKMEEVIAVREIKTKIVETAIKNMSENISKEMGKAHHDHLIAQATEDFQKIIN